MRISNAKSDFVYVVIDLKGHKYGIVHYQRVTPYPASVDVREVPNVLVLQHKHLGSGEQLVERIENIRKHNGHHEMLVNWEGLQEDGEKTWEQVDSLYEEVLGLVMDFLHTPGKRSL